MKKKVFSLELLIVPIIGLFTIVLACLMGGIRYFSQCFLLNGADLFMDFFNSIRDAAKFDVYTEYKVIYSPLLNLFFMFCSFFIPGYALDHSTNRYVMQKIPMSYVLLIIYFIGCLVLLFFSMKKLLGTKKKREFYYLYLIVVLSFPFLYAAERGNMLLLTIGLIITYFAYSQSDKKYQQELAIIALSLATVIKLYPVIFVLILFKHKKWRDITKYGIYTSVLLFAPFVFYGGVEALYIMVSTALNLFKDQLQYFTNLYLVLSFGFGINNLIAKLVNYFIVILFVINFFFFTRKKYQEYMALAIILMCLTVGTEPYTSIFFLAGLLLLIKEEEKSYTELVYLLLMLMYLLFNAFTWFLNVLSIAYMMGFYVLHFVVMPISLLQKKKQTKLIEEEPLRA